MLLEHFERLRMLDEYQAMTYLYYNVDAVAAKKMQEKIGEAKAKLDSFLSLFI
jgi:hypothetical protein